MFGKKVEEFLENVAVKHATSASSLVFYEPRCQRNLCRLLKRKVSRT